MRAVAPNRSRIHARSGSEAVTVRCDYLPGVNVRSSWRMRRTDVWFKSRLILPTSKGAAPDCSGVRDSGTHALDDGLATAAGQHRRAAEASRLALCAGRPQAGPREDRRDHDLHLERGERRPKAAAHTAAEWDPGIRLRRTVEEALG